MKAPAGYRAEYAGKHFETGRNDKEYNSLYCGGGLQDYQVADIYIKLKDGSIQRLIEFPEAKAQKWVAELPTELRDFSVAEYTGGGLAQKSYRVDGENSLAFHNGKLVTCIITERRPSTSPFFNVQVGASADGEFLSFPISHEDLVRVFGKPTNMRKLTD
jgi:hypothetical protein